MCSSWGANVVQWFLLSSQVVCSDRRWPHGGSLVIQKMNALLKQFLLISQLLWACFTIRNHILYFHAYMLYVLDLGEFLHTMLIYSFPIWPELESLQHRHHSGVRILFWEDFPMALFGSKHFFLTHVSPCNNVSRLPAGWCQLFWLDKVEQQPVKTCLSW